MCICCYKTDIFQWTNAPAACERDLFWLPVMKWVLHVDRTEGFCQKSSFIFVILNISLDVGLLCGCDNTYLYKKENVKAKFWPQLRWEVGETRVWPASDLRREEEEEEEEEKDKMAGPTSRELTGQQYLPPLGCDVTSCEVTSSNIDRGGGVVVTNQQPIGFGVKILLKGY